MSKDSVSIPTRRIHEISICPQRSSKQPLTSTSGSSLSRSYEFKIEVSREGKKIKYDKYQLKIFGKVKGVMKQMFNPFKMPEIEWHVKVFCNGKKVYAD